MALELHHSLPSVRPRSQQGEFAASTKEKHSLLEAKHRAALPTSSMTLLPASSASLYSTKWLRACHEPCSCACALLVDRNMRPTTATASGPESRTIPTAAGPPPREVTMAAMVPGPPSQPRRRSPGASGAGAGVPAWASTRGRGGRGLAGGWGRIWQVGSISQRVKGWGPPGGED